MFLVSLPDSSLPMHPFTYFKSLINITCYIYKFKQWNQPPVFLLGCLHTLHPFGVQYYPNSAALKWDASCIIVLFYLCWINHLIGNEQSWRIQANKSLGTRENGWVLQESLSAGTHFANNKANNKYIYLFFFFGLRTVRIATDISLYMCFLFLQKAWNFKNALSISDESYRN